MDAIDATLVIIDAIVVAVVAVGVVGLMAGGINHWLYQQTIGAVYGLVTMPGLTSGKLAVLVVSMLALFGPVWHGYIRPQFWNRASGVPVSGDKEGNRFEFHHESDSSKQSTDTIAHRANGGSPRQPGHRSDGDEDWITTVFGGASLSPERDDDDDKQSRIRSRSAVVGSPTGRTTAENRPVEQAPADDNRVETPDRRTSRAEIATENCASAIVEARNRIGTVSTALASDRSNPAPGLGIGRTDVAFDEEALEDCSTGSGHELSTAVDRVRDDERAMKASINRTINRS